MTGAARQPPRAVPGPVEGHGRARARARLLIGRPRPRARTERRSSGMPLMACAARAVPDGSRRVAGVLVRTYSAPVWFGLLDGWGRAACCACTVQVGS